MPASTILSARLLLAILALACAGPIRAADVAKPKLDPARIYRFDPLLEKFEPIDRKALKPLNVYHRYSPQFGRWVWSKVTEDGRLAYTLGPGSVQQTSLFDPTASFEERRLTLEAKAPALARLFTVQGAKAAVILTPEGKWVLHGVSSVARVHDLETGERWEWHGDRRLAVTHGGGNSWSRQDSRWVPVGHPAGHAAVHGDLAVVGCCD
jgi:hypothetical protein